MRLPNLKSKQPIPAWKVALIPGLLMILGMVLWPKSDEEPLQLATIANPPSTATKSVKSGLPPLPVVELQEALAYDPFQLPDSLQTLIVKAPEVSDSEDAAAAARSQQEAARHAQIDGLRQLQVSMVLRTQKGTAAVINSKIVRVGDELQPGVRVIKIESDSVTVRMEPVVEESLQPNQDK